MDQNHHLAKVRVAGSNPVFRSCVGLTITVYAGVVGSVVFILSRS
jgi:hypothetical protein